MLINTEEYIHHLVKELPDFNFTSLSKIEDYKNNSEVYEVCFEKDKEGKKKEYSYRMLAGYFDFTEEEQKNNFVSVAKLTYKARNKEDAEEEKQEEETKS